MCIGCTSVFVSYRCRSERENCEIELAPWQFIASIDHHQSKHHHGQSRLRLTWMRISCRRLYLGSFASSYGFCGVCFIVIVRIVATRCCFEWTKAKIDWLSLANWSILRPYPSQPKWQKTHRTQPFNRQFPHMESRILSSIDQVPSQFFKKAEHFFFFFFFWLAAIKIRTISIDSVDTFTTAEEPMITIITVNLITLFALQTGAIQLGLFIDFFVYSNYCVSIHIHIFSSYCILQLGRQ